MMVTETAQLINGSGAVIEVDMKFIGLIQTEYTAKLTKFLTRIKEESGLFPDAEPDIFKLPGTENDNINRKFELNTTLVAADPVEYPAWTIICRVVRKGSPDVLIKEVVDSGSFITNLDDSKIIIYLTGV